jgi:hypothetical protein
VRRRGHRTRRAPDLLLDGLAANFSAGYSAGFPILRSALTAFDEHTSTEEEALRWLWLACSAALHLWDDATWDTFSSRRVQLTREAGALSELPLALSHRAYVLLFAGDLAAAALLVEEVEAATEAMGSKLAPHGALGLAALRGREAETSALASATKEEVVLRGEGVGIGVTAWGNAVLNNSLGRYDKCTGSSRRSQRTPG